jgi:peptide/nickel transport system substrate-binding protein
MMRKAVGLRLPGARLVLVAGLLIAGLASGPAWAERLLRLEEVPLGEADPAKVQDYADSILMMNVYDTLTFAKPVGGVQPQLAESWESSEDGKTYTFTLEEANFHDGSPVTAEDVVFSLERMKALGMGFAHLFRDVSASAVDERTVAFQLAEPSAPFLATLVRLPILSQDAGTRRPSAR